MNNRKKRNEIINIECRQLSDWKTIENVLLAAALIRILFEKLNFTCIVSTECIHWSVNRESVEIVSAEDVRRRQMAELNAVARNSILFGGILWRS